MELLVIYVQEAPSVLWVVLTPFHVNQGRISISLGIEMRLTATSALLGSIVRGMAYTYQLGSVMMVFIAQVDKIHQLLPNLSALLAITANLVTVHLDLAHLAGTKTNLRAQCAKHVHLVTTVTVQKPQSVPSLSFHALQVISVYRKPDLPQSTHALLEPSAMLLD